MGTVKYTGSIASFHCPTEATIRSLKVHFSPKQLGDGTPSPENVREIVGWDGVQVQHSQKNLAHFVGYSAVNLNAPTATRKLVNGNGTTISTIDLERSVVITQELWPNNSKSSYQNGYFVYIDDNLKFEERYDISFRVTNIVSNPLNATLSDLAIYNPRGASVGGTKIIDGDRITFKNAIYNQNTATPLRHGFDIRICGMSCTISDFIVTAVDTEDRAYAPYQGETVEYEFGVLGKNKLNADAEQQSPDNTNMMPANKRIFTPNTYCVGMSWSNYYVPNNIKSYSVSNGTINVTNANVYGLGYPVSVVPGQAYYLSATTTNGRAHVAYFASDGTYVSGVSTDILNTSFTAPNGADVAVIIFFSVSGEATFSNIQLELGSTATAYEPYDPNHTVYGGWVDLISGEVVSTYLHCKIKDLPGEWNYRSGNNRFQITLTDNYANAASSGGIWTHFATSEVYATSTSNGYGNKQIATYIDKHIYIRDDDFEGDAEAFLNSVGDTYVTYELAESTTYFLSPIAMRTFLGHNSVWSNADYVEVEYDLHETQDILNRKNFIIANQPRIVTPAPSGLVSFSADMSAPLKECKVHFSPVQEGSGDPSPDNVRPITGWTGCEVYRTGKNLFPEELLADYSNYPNSGNYGYMYTDPIHLTPNTTYHLEWTRITENNDPDCYWGLKTYSGTSYDLPDAGVFQYYCNGANGFRSYSSFNSGPTGIIRFALNRSTGDYTTQQSMLDDIFGKAQFVMTMGSDATSYEPYQGQTLAIDWSDEAGTVYGGYVDLAKGEVVREVIKVTTNEIVSFHDITDRGNGVYEICLNLPIYARSERRTEAKCSCFVYGSTSTGIADRFDLTYILNQKARQVRISHYFEEAPTIEVYKEYLQSIGFEVVYYIDQENYPIDPITLKTIRGTNNIWSNANDSIDIKFWRHGGGTEEEWDYIYRPDANGYIIPESAITVTAGQTVVMSWKTTDTTNYTNRYVWRCIGARFDDATGDYNGLIMSNAPMEATVSYKVTKSGRFIAGNYKTASESGVETTAYIGNYIKVRIVNPN